MPYWRFIQVTVYSHAGEQEELAWRTDFLPDVPCACILPPALSYCTLVGTQEALLQAWVKAKKKATGYLRPLPMSQSWGVKSASSRQLWEGGSPLLKLDSFEAVNCPSCYSYRTECIFAPCAAM